MVDIIVIGAGVSGCMIARKLAQYELNVIVLDKENDVGNFSSMANSAIIHSGYDPEPGTLKAKLNVLGNKMYDKVADELDVSFRRIGSLTVAFDQEQVAILKKIAVNAAQNGVEVKFLDAIETRKIEPNINQDVIMSLYAPSAGIIDPFNLCVHAMENAIDNGVILHLNEEVKAINKIDNGYQIITDKNQYEASIVINASGLQGDIIDHLLSPSKYIITPRKGEYFVLDHFDNTFVNHVIFPLPSSKGKGILVSPTSSQNYIVGPSSEIIEDRDDLATTRVTLEEIKKQGLKIIPNLPFNQVIRTFSGLRATGNTRDFIIEEKENYPGFINVIGIESPGLASAPAIAEMVVMELVRKRVTLIPKKDYNPRVKKYIKTKYLSIEEKKMLIEDNPLYGKIICRCEQISEQEIIDVMNRNCPPNSIKGVKKRVRAGFGKCQGGMCQPQVIFLLYKYRHLPLNQVPYDGPQTIILKKFVKGDNHD